MRLPGDPGGRSATPSAMARRKGGNGAGGAEAGELEAGELSEWDAGELGEWDAGDDDFNVPPRGWLLGTAFCRGFLSSLLGDGGVGKTSVRLAQLLSLAIGRSLTGEHVHHRARVLLVSFEDGRDKLRRRVRAAMLHHGIAPADVKGWLFLAAPRGLRLAEMRDGSHHIGALEAELRRTIVERQIDLVYLDPFVKAHGLPENDNVAIDFVCSVLANLATELNIAADAPHHKRKGTAAAGDADSGRGASAFKDAGRLVYTLTTMTPDEAAALGVAEAERRRLVRLDSAKVNITPPSADATWFKLVGVKLSNATTDYPNGDEVQTVELWTPPDLWRVINTFIANQILDKIDAVLPDGRRYSDSATAGPERAAWRLVLAAAPSLTEAQCRKVIATWLENGVLFKEKYHDPTDRKERAGLFVNAIKRPGQRDE